MTSLKTVLTKMSLNKSFTLSFKTIEYNSIVYLLNIKDKTAFVVQNKSTSEEIVIPSYIEYENQEYYITKILEGSFSKSRSIKLLRFSEDSQLQTIEKKSFSYSAIECIIFPSSLTDLKEGWCQDMPYINKIVVKPNNPIYQSYEDKFILGKSKPEKNFFDVLVFSIRNIVTETVPDFIEIIGPFAFERCEELKTIKFSEDSCLKIIEKYAFLNSSIEKFSLPIHVTRICQSAFLGCLMLETIDSKLRIIEKYAFYDSSIEKITIPKNVIELKEGWCGSNEKNKNFICMNNNIILRKSLPEKENYNVIVCSICSIDNVSIPNFIEIIEPFAFSQSKIHYIEFPNDINIEKIEKSTFELSLLNSFILPLSVTSIDEYAFNCCFNLQKFEIKQNSELRLINRFAFADSFVNYIFIPKKTKIIGERAFIGCRKLIKVEISSDSELTSIEREAFSHTSIESILIPSRVTKIGNGIFKSCDEMKIIEFDENLEIEVIDPCKFVANENTLIMIPVKLQNRVNLTHYLT